ncbi:putative iron-regulated heparin binding hemagglutinin HbhA [Mycobacteroides abscessus 21]|uniref:Putative iron-regulated heparin binding hemagglutinin HbhA n=1 Tax=Mycobacteroides abscessus 21 TaxID=1299324 RepID=A0A829PY21_9MYCO|nr:putative iron-regulated heparin binding hemagglutinin HbhA [Mycobacteroides abscessus 21]
MTKKNTSFDDLKTPFYVAVGAGDLALAAVADVVVKLRERAEEAASEAGARVDETRDRLRELSAELPTDVNELRDRFTPEELRKVAEAYLQVATDIYNNLAERGEEAIERLRSTPGIEENVTRAEGLVGNYAELTEQALGTVASQTRAVGERAAKLVGIDLSGKATPAKKAARPRRPRQKGCPGQEGCAGEGCCQEGRPGQEGSGQEGRAPHRHPEVGSSSSNSHPVSHVG